MRICPELIRLFLAATCACAALAVGPTSHSQATSTAMQVVQNIQLNSPQNPFAGFISYVGRENDRIRAGGQSDGPHFDGKTDYVAAIGIDQGEERAMLAILLDAHHKEESLEHKERGDETCQFLSTARWHELLQQYGEADARKFTRAEEEGCVKENLAIQQEAWTELNKELGEESIKKLASYVNKTPWMPVQQKDPNPCPPNYNPPPGQTTHLACNGFYDEFFYAFGQTDKWNRRIAAEGSNEHPAQFNTSITGIYLSEGMRQAVIALGLDASREMDESDRRFGEAWDQYCKQHNVQTVPQPYPPEIDALGRMRGTIVEEYIYRFRQTVGEDIFNQFDKSLSGGNRSIMKAADATAPARGSGATQTPAVHQ